MRGTCIRGIGAYIPEERRPNEWWPKEWVEQWVSKQKGLLNRLSEAGQSGEDFVHPLLQEALKEIGDDPFVGLRDRRVAPPDMRPSDMELAAAREAMENAGVGPDDIGLVMTFSAPTDYMQFPNAWRVNQELGMTKALAFGMQAACFSINAMMHIAHRFISCGVHNHALLITSCKYSDILDYTTSMSVQSGDGAAAFVLGPCKEGEGINTVYERSNTEFHDALTMVERPPVISERSPYSFGPNQNQARRFISAVKPALAAKLIAGVPFWAEEAGKAALSAAGWRGSDVDLLITNAATAWYAPVVARVLDVAPEAIEENTLEYGNMAGTNLPVNLYTAWKKGRTKPGSRVLFFGHGGGASFGAITYVWPSL